MPIPSFPGLPGGVTNHSQIRVPTKRPSNAAEYLDIGMYGKDVTPSPHGEMLKNYCEEHDLEYTDDNQDAYLAQNHQHEWQVVVRACGFLKICARTGLWLPGNICHYEVGKSRYCEASCYTRFSTTDTQWVSVSSSVRFDNFYDRDFCDPNYINPDVVGDWVIIPDIKLAEVAEVSAARKALRDLVAQHITFYARPRNLLHKLIFDQAQQAGRWTPDIPD